MKEGRKEGRREGGGRLETSSDDEARKFDGGFEPRLPAPSHAERFYICDVAVLEETDEPHQIQIKIQTKPKEIQTTPAGLSATTSDTSRPPPASSTTRSRPGAQDALRWVRTLLACALPPADALAMWDVLLRIMRQLPRSG